ncbi:hypothetical protein K402DRAFT_341775 [Aulographum hederae CBS 113979]|uniref:NAD(P)-binding domain-containing protein n=1 Tax=Aulographum hederae CBS 113979 TaxID=1176131 RepID=A0A6G1GLQ3_9PEZI|nr:hypothetical protein K402DRAFT_341775 [Aulographum hederae CBS 113979]
MKLILSGVTGFIGHQVLVQALLSPESITSIIVLSRRVLPDSCPKDPRITTLVLSDADFLSYPPSVLSKLHGASACIWALGIKLADAEAHKRVTVDYTAAAARAFAALSPPEGSAKFRFLFLSGALAVSDPDARVLFLDDMRKLKGEGEKQVMEIAKENSRVFEAVVARPGMVHALGLSLTGILMALLPGDMAGVKVDTLADALVGAAVEGWEEVGNKTWSNGELVRRGREVAAKRNA